MLNAYQREVREKRIKYKVEKVWVVRKEERKEEKSIRWGKEYIVAIKLLGSGVSCVS